MNAVSNFWNKLFPPSNKGDIGAAPSVRQCQVSEAVFGPGHPAKAQCDMLDIKAIANELSNYFIGPFNEVVAGMTADLSKVKEGLSALEYAEFEERALTPRLGAMMFADDPAGSLSLIGRKTKAGPPAGSVDWIDNAQHLAGRDAAKKRAGTKNQPLNQRLSPGSYRKKYPFE